MKDTGNTKTSHEINTPRRKPHSRYITRYVATASIIRVKITNEKNMKHAPPIVTSRLTKKSIIPPLLKVSSYNT